jgi:peptide-methionine (S)-S-oxide reductase
VFFHSPEQEQAANRVVEELTASRVWPRPIVTEIVPFRKFFPAEDYHQQYYRKNQGQGYCQVVIAPKVAKFRKEHLDRLKTFPSG